MRKYEILYIIDKDVDDESREKIIADVVSFIENNGGKCEEPDKWGIRKYAYPINFKQEGYYCLINFEAENNVPKMLSDKLNISKNVVRHMIVAK